ncbi:peptidyl-prolyl cis-trans isomerase D [Thermoflavifilum aggregans]|uniref:Periplasmic chaperone PpiD n=1 Tax=Thermoflavifilum aggregans TaxID=454188 RepID=A0A2M9CRT1_9BACT|nr:peptidylprolyl isomerase [Thermoflavifilum aggregans]PJJ74599.1 peptidyl-prolyl cis-trans isomerase D [Thermoflavifilum aggregans]
MSVIQKIREKYATLMVVAICVSLVAFLLMDAFVGPRSFFHHSNDVAVINGEGIPITEFSNMEQDAENAARQQNPNLSDEARQQIREQVWNQLLSDVILGDEYQKLGIMVTNEEIVDRTATPDADPQIQAIPIFKNPQTGEFDPGRVVQFIRNMDQDQTGQARQFWNQIQQYLLRSIPQRKFYDLVRQSIYYPKWLAQMDLQDRSTNATVHYVSIPYSTIPDSAVKYTDQELQQYLDTHQALFKQEASRGIEYVSFDVIPTPADSAQILKQLNTLKTDLQQATLQNLPGFINRNSDIPFYDGYQPKDQLMTSQRDEVFGLAPGQVIGPYLDNGSYTIARMLDKKVLPDTVEVRLILISTQNTPDSVAKQRIDSIATAIEKGASFDQLALRYSDDPGSRQQGGHYTFSAAQVQDPNFSPEVRQFILFDGKKGSHKVVKSSLGYFYIQILDQRNFEPMAKVAFLSKQIVPSQQTDNEVFSQASRFAGMSQTREAFEQNARKQGLTVRQAAEVYPTDYVIPGIGQARALIQWMYNDAKINQVSNVFSLNNRYVVAVLTQIRKKGVAPLAEVRPQIAAEIIRQKKANMIAEKVGKPASLDSLASQWKFSVQEAQHVNFTAPYVPGAGFEPKVIGYVFYRQLKPHTVSPAIPGNNGVYYLQVDSLYQEAPGITLESLRQNMESTRQSDIIAQLFDMLKENSHVVDNRIKYQ